MRERPWEELPAAVDRPADRSPASGDERAWIEVDPALAAGTAGNREGDEQPDEKAV